MHTDQYLQDSSHLETSSKESAISSFDSATGKKPWDILRFHKIKSFFYTKNTLPKLFCKPKDRVAIEENKNNIVYEIDCSNCKAVYLNECKWSLKM